MAQRFDSKIEEVKSEMKFLTGRIEWVNTKRGGKLESGKIDKTNSVVKEIHNSFAAFDLTCFSFVFFSSRPPRGTNNRHLIDSMHMKLEQTNKKLGEVKSKCTKAVKSCLRMQMESVSRRSLIELWRVWCGKREKWRENGNCSWAGGKENFPFYFDFYYFSAHTWGSLFSTDCTDTNFLFTSSCDIWDILPGRIYDPVEGSLRKLFMKDLSMC